ncbi:MAG TPA: ABC transporter permease [Chloroflexota bacterium]|nr:ABC transporter permease [Chloroflexota bacterium]
MRVDYLVRRLIQFVIVLWGAATLNFILPRLAPGNPVRERLLSALATGGYQQAGIEEMVRAYNEQFGLDKPLYVQYLLYLQAALQLDFGYSIASYPAKVLNLIMAALPWTISLLLVSTLISFVLGTLLGALMAWPRSPRFVRHLVLPMMALSAIPYYLLGLVLVYSLGILVPMFPISGGYAIGSLPNLSWAFIQDAIYHSILPALSIVLSAAGFWAIGMRGMMVTTEGEDYVVYAEAKGIPERGIFLHYALRNAILPQLTSLALSLGTVVSGAVVVEIVFGYPGVGSLLFQAIRSLDYFVIYGVVFMTVLAIAIATLALDLTYPLVDPRISYRGA